MNNAISSLAMIAAFLLAGAGIWLILAKRDRKRGLLMLIAALVIGGNVAIWSIPLPAPDQDRSTNG